MPPRVYSEEVPYDPRTHHCDALELTKPLVGHLWWNSLFWTNFPPLAMLDENAWEEHPDEVIPAALSQLNSDGRLAEQYITFCSAREDLIASTPASTAGFKLTVECMQYEGVRDYAWQFPLADYIPNRDNHQFYDLQARRFWDNGVLHLGLNAEEFSERVKPVSELNACIHVVDKAAADNPTWGYHHVVMRIEGWPYRIKRIGTFEGCGDGSHRELNIGITHTDDDPLWSLLEGRKAATSGSESGSEEEEQGNLRKGYKFWASLLDLDWLGPKLDVRKEYDPEIPPEKGYVWFVVVDTITVPSTGRKGVKIQLLEEGIVPAWLDLNFLQVFAGSVPLGNVNAMESEGPPAGKVEVCRTGADATAQSTGERRVVVDNTNSRLVFSDPISLQVNDFVDLGWAIHDCCYKGATIKLGPKLGRWVQDVGHDEGMTEYKTAGAPGLCHGEGEEKVIIQRPLTDYTCERRLVT